MGSAPHNPRTCDEPNCRACWSAAERSLLPPHMAGLEQRIKDRAFEQAAAVVEAELGETYAKGGSFELRIMSSAALAARIRALKSNAPPQFGLAARLKK